MGEVTEIVGGGTPRTDEPTNFEGGDIPWITPADLSGYKAKYIANGARFITTKGLQGSGARLMSTGTVLFSSRAPIGYVAIASQPVSTNQGFKSFVPKAGLDSEFVFYYLQRAREMAVALASGTTFLEISGAKAANIPIPIPPLAEQRRIVAEIERHFSRLDAAVAGLSRARGRFRRYRASVLESAVTGHLLGNHRGDGSLPFGLRPVLRETKLSPGWSWLSVREVGYVQLGRQRSPQHHQGPHMRPYLRVANVYDNRLNLTDINEMNFEPGEFVRFALTPGDILLNEGQSRELVGRAAIYRGEVPGACFQNTLLRFRAGPKIDVRFALIVFRTYFYSGHFSNIARWTTSIAHLGADRFASMAFPVPPLEEQRAIADEVERRLSVADQMEKTVHTAIRRAERLRQGLLRRAFEGSLVPQDPADEPASVLLERIRRERDDDQDTTRAIRKPRTLNGTVRRRRITADEPPYEIPTFSPRRAVAESPADYQQTSFIEENR